MKFLVQIDVRLAGELTDAERAELLEAELERGRELVATGVIWAVGGHVAKLGGRGTRRAGAYPR